MTDGMLLREFLGEPDLASYSASAIILDEAHEHAIRNLLRLLIDSRTSRASGPSSQAARLERDPRRGQIQRPLRQRARPQHPVAALPGGSSCTQAAVVTTLQIHITQPLPGDLLIFFGQDEIEASLPSDRPRLCYTKWACLDDNTTPRADHPLQRLSHTQVARHQRPHPHLDFMCGRSTTAASSPRWAGATAATADADLDAAAQCSPPPPPSSAQPPPSPSPVPPTSPSPPPPPSPGRPCRTRPHLRRTV